MESKKVILSYCFSPFFSILLPPPFSPWLSCLTWVKAKVSFIVICSHHSFFCDSPFPSQRRQSLQLYDITHSNFPASNFPMPSYLICNESSSVFNKSFPDLMLACLFQFLLICSPLHSLSFSSSHWSWTFSYRLCPWGFGICPPCCLQKFLFVIFTPFRSQHKCHTLK